MKKRTGNEISVKGFGQTEMSAQKGFTLVELSIVLVIIGLIIGGVLKGQELIGNAQIKNVVSQAQAYQAATVAFRDKYGSLPGDVVGPNNIIPNCTAAPCSPGGAGLGDGLVGATANANYTTDVSAAAENVAFWQQLAVTRFIGDIELGTTSTAIFGSRFPSAATGGGFQVLYQNTTGRHVLRLAGTVATPSNANGALRPDQALQIDRVIDDGQPVTGSVFTNTNLSDGAGTNACITVATNIYTSANSNRTCNLVIDIN
ncbi:MAG: prepilin-type N-terminal cleavage/methylation domain-containing protein [Alphaproteobacteria bacterium]|nr:prepilin-type N-terminal cleavage/methylation domain-containing protein [Alphaproteobacteria bacterium]